MEKFADTERMIQFPV